MKGNQFERELEKLEKNIVQIDTRQKTAHINKRRFIAYLIYVCVLTELIIIAWYYLHKKPTALVDKLKDGLPLVLPLLLYASFIYSLLLVLFFKILLFLQLEYNLVVFNNFCYRGYILRTIITFYYTRRIKSDGMSNCHFTSVNLDTKKTNIRYILNKYLIKS